MSLLSADAIRCPSDEWLDSIQLLDCVLGMRSLPPKSIDIVIADPPYNLSKGGQWSWDGKSNLPGFGGPWKKAMEGWDDMGLDDYLRFTFTWLKEVQRVVKPTGSIWICGTYHNIGLINFAFQALGIEIINEVVWYKRNAFPNLSGRRLTASHETLLWGHVGGKRREYFFDYEAMKNGDFPEDGLKRPGTQMRTVWDIPNNKRPDERRFGSHPTQKPVRLCMRILKCSSKVGDVCLVPFAGTGSECVAALTLDRHFIGFEVDEGYLAVAQKRLSAAGTPRLI